MSCTWAVWKYKIHHEQGWSFLPLLLPSPSPSPPPAAEAGGVETHACTQGVHGQQTAGAVQLTLVQAKILISTKLFFTEHFPPL